jgi:hypothetical protein
MDEDEKITTDGSAAGEKSAGQAVMISPAGELDRLEQRNLEQRNLEQRNLDLGDLDRRNLDKGDTERNGVFINLVREDGDIIGLVAYSIYKQNKVDWLQAFQKTLGRGPNDAELNSYIIGESTPRRLAIYRHLAGATLTGNGPDAVSDTAWLSNSIGARQTDQNKRGSAWILSSVLSYAILAAAILIGVWLVARYGLPARP